MRDLPHAMRLKRMSLSSDRTLYLCDMIRLLTDAGHAHDYAAWAIRQLIDDGWIGLIDNGHGFEPSVRVTPRLLEWERSLDAVPAVDAGAVPSPLPADHHPLSVNVGKREACLKGVRHPIRSEMACRLVAALLTAPGEWFGPKKDRSLAATDPKLEDARPDKLVKALPDAVRAWIECRRRDGTRIRPDTPAAG